MALKDLAERAKIPAFVVRYTSDFSIWTVTPITDQSRAIQKQAHMTEKEYVRFLYMMRSGYLPEDLFDDFGKPVNPPPIDNEKIKAQLSNGNGIITIDGNTQLRFQGEHYND